MADLKKIFASFRAVIRYDEPLSRHTSFRIGGPADAFARPRSADELAALLKTAHAAGVPVFVIGAGANILVSDKGVRGLVVSLERFREFSLGPAGENGRLAAVAGAGLPAAVLAGKTIRAGARGLERFVAMPGSVGGAVWMNARCYESSFSDSLVSVTALDRDLNAVRAPVNRAEFDYKKSPFQTNGCIILRAEFELTPADPRSLAAVQREIERDRRAKGHFVAPSAGSVFKNDRAFGAPTGRLLDSLGFKGRQRGGAEVSLLHANIILNRKRASAADVKVLIAEMERAMKDRYGFRLEREILYIGED